MTDIADAADESPDELNGTEWQAFAADLGRMFSERMSAKERARLFAALCRALWRNSADGADQAVRALQVLPAKVPIRDREQLTAQFGADPEQQAAGVIRDASRMVGAVWAAAAVAPVPPPVAHTAKVVLHSVVEIRLIGELYAVYDDPQPRDAGWVNTIMHAWAAGVPVRRGPVALMNVQQIAAKFRTASIELISDYTRLARLMRGGRDGRMRIAQLGSRFQRRMRFDPAGWPDPEGAVSVQDLVIGAVVGLLAKRLGLAGGVAAKLIEVRTSAGRDKPAPEGKLPDRPDAYLELAWSEHLAARNAVTADGSRLDQAVTTLEGTLRTLSHRMSAQPPVIPAQRVPAHDAADPYEHIRLANAAVDLVETLGGQPRRLASWPLYGRNALVYAIAALLVGAPVALAGVSALNGSEGTARAVSVVSAAACLPPFLSFGAGVLAVGWAFRPWLGGPVPRTPVLGAVVCGATAALVALGLLIYALA